MNKEGDTKLATESERERRLERLLCVFCHNVPVDVCSFQPCAHTFCAGCLRGALLKKKAGARCPHCERVVESFQMKDRQLLKPLFAMSPTAYFDELRRRKEVKVRLAEKRRLFPEELVETSRFVYSDNELISILVEYMPQPEPSKNLDSKENVKSEENGKSKGSVKEEAKELKKEPKKEEEDAPCTSAQAAARDAKAKKEREKTDDDCKGPPTKRARNSRTKKAEAEKKKAVEKVKEEKKEDKEVEKKPREMRKEPIRTFRRFFRAPAGTPLRCMRKIIEKKIYLVDSFRLHFILPSNQQILEDSMKLGAVASMSGYARKLPLRICFSLTRKDDDEELPVLEMETMPELTPEVSLPPPLPPPQMSLLTPPSLPPHLVASLSMQLPTLPPGILPPNFRGVLNYGQLLPQPAPPVQCRKRRKLSSPVKKGISPDKKEKDDDVVVIAEKKAPPRLSLLQSVPLPVVSLSQPLPLPSPLVSHTNASVPPPLPPTPTAAPPVPPPPAKSVEEVPPTEPSPASSCPPVLVPEVKSETVTATEEKSEKPPSEPKIEVVEGSEKTERTSPSESPSQKPPNQLRLPTVAAGSALAATLVRQNHVDKLLLQKMNADPQRPPILSSPLLTQTTAQ